MIEKNWKELIKPAKLTVKHNNDDKSNATIIAEPIERGFGVTLGNSLRRIPFKEALDYIRLRLCLERRVRDL